MLPLHRAIYLWRVEKGLTQAELARRSGIPRPNISTIEQGLRDLTLSTLRRIAEALEIRPGILADGIPPEIYRHERWSRESLDRMARYLVGLKAWIPSRERQAADLIRPLIAQKLRLKKEVSGDLALRLRKARRERIGLAAARSQFDPSQFQNLLSRIDKLTGGKQRE